MDKNTQLLIAANLKYLRNIFGYTQCEVAEKLHLCRSTYAVYESGEKAPGTDTILNLAKLYHVHIDTLLQTDHSKFLNDIISRKSTEDTLEELIRYYHSISKKGHIRVLKRAEMLHNEEQEMKALLKKESSAQVQIDTDAEEE